MKPQETSSKLEANGVHSNGHALLVDEIIDDHMFTGCVETPMLPDAFEMDDDEKVARISEKFADILTILGMDLSDDSLRDTPQRVAKMYVKEIFSGLNPANKPKVQMFANSYGYNRMLVERNITLHSYCEHHLVPIIGKVHVAYMSNGHVIGLSKINRIVRYFAKRPQVQERLTEQIAMELKSILQTDDVAVLVEADHFCVITRGIEDAQSSTVTSHYSGAFEEDNRREEFLKYIDLGK
ncbi:MAG: GTP cyclohydrolase I FolE [Cryomorphaceae bacterium]|nr:GTP cyclohydrolase I FolE [Cryomorphaceae bacterium]